jgi:hypothetical protein
MPLPPLRFTIRRFMVTVAAVALMIAGYLWMVRPPVMLVEIGNAAAIGEHGLRTF